MPDSAPDAYAPQPSFWEKHQAWGRPAAAGILTAGLTIASFPPSNAPETAYAFAAPAIFWAYLRPSLKEYAATLFLAQAVAWTVLLGWLHHVTWAGLFLLGPFVGAWIGVWYLAVWWAMPRMVGRSTPVRLAAQLGLAGLWVVIEWTRTWFLGGFSWLPLAASQWQRASILQIAAYTGAGGISFVLIAMNVGFAAYGHRLLREGAQGLRRRSQEFLFALFLLLVCLCILVRETLNRQDYTEPLARVAFVQPDIPQAVKWDPAQAPAVARTLRDLTLRAGAGHPDLILWPEASTPWAVKDEPTMRAFVEALARRTQAPILLGSVAVERPAAGPELWYNAAFVVAPDIGLQPAYYAKRKLVPFGEFVPFRPLLGWLSKVVPIGDDFTPGRDSAPLIVSLPGGATAFGPLICYEDTYPQLAREDVRSGADALVVLTNNGWFGRGGAAYQHAAHSVLRAVETRRPVLRCGNAGWSGWIDEFGGIRPGAVLQDENGSVYFRGTRTIRVMRDTRWIGRESFYVAHGDWFVLVSAALALFGAAALGMGRKVE